MRWTGDHEFEIDGLKFFINPGNYKPGQGDSSRFHILKGRSFFDVYDGLFQSSPIKNMIELGVFDGGSTLYFLKKYKVEKLLAIDILETPRDLVEAVNTHHLMDRVRLSGKTSQDDETAIRRHFTEFFNGQPVDLIIDDASHYFELTKRSLEICLSLVRPGGFYVLEDWSWPHVTGTQPGEPSYEIFKGKTALSNVLFLAQILMASQPGFISDIHVYPNCAVMRRGYTPINGTMDMDKLCLNRGQPFNLA
jgi:hypothetical protein